MTTTAGRWTAVTASVRGSSHTRDGRPNQDAVRVVQVSGPTPGLVAAVCDGHGGDRYVRSDTGARFGVEVACEVGRETLHEMTTPTSTHSIETLLSATVAGDIVERWRRRVLDDVASHPFTGSERERVGDGIDADPLISYGCTLVMVIAAPSWLGLLQIGDGDIILVDGQRTDSPVPEDHRLVGGETTSLCLPTAVHDARTRAVLDPLPDAVILTSDGYANSFASPNWRHDAGLDLRDQLRAIGPEGVDARLAGWLADSAAAGGDDVTMALLHRVEALQPHTVDPPSARRRRIGVRLLGATAVAAVLGLAVGWVIGRAGEQPTQAATTPSNAAIPASVPTTTDQAATPESTTSVASTSTTTATTTTSTEAPSGTPQSLPRVGATSVPLCASQVPVLLVGDGIALLIVTYPDRPIQYVPPVVVWMPLGDDRDADLLDEWVLRDGQLALDDAEPRPALAVAGTGDYVFAMGVDRDTLTTYAADTGQEVAQVRLSDGAEAPSGKGVCDSGAREQSGKGD